jgi:hypothetical protein
MLPDSSTGEFTSLDEPTDDVVLIGLQLPPTDPIISDLKAD